MHWATACGALRSVRGSGADTFIWCIEIAETFGACMKIGAIRVGLNPRLATREITALIADCSPRVIFVHSDHAALVRSAQEELIQNGIDFHVIVFGNQRSEYEALIDAHLRLAGLTQSAHDVAMIAYTTGSTGLPKEPYIRTKASCDQFCM